MLCTGARIVAVLKPAAFGDGACGAYSIGGGARDIVGGLNSRAEGFIVELSEGDDVGLDSEEKDDEDEETLLQPFCLRSYLPLFPLI